MVRGTTPQLTFKIGIAPSRFLKLFITAEQSGKLAFERSLDEVVKNESTKTVSFRLTQEETLALNDRSPVYIQARGLLADNVAVASPILQFSVDGILREGVL